MADPSLHIVFAEEFDESAVERARSVGHVTQLPACDDATLINAVGSCDALLVRTRARVTSALLGRAKRLRVIGRGGAGLDNIDTEAARQRGITVVYTPEAATDSIFAVIGEEFGFIGAFLVIAAFLGYLCLGIKISMKAPDAGGFYLGLGLTLLVTLEAFINILEDHYNLIPCLSYKEAKDKLDATIQADASVQKDLPVILLDIKMADMDGINVFHLLKERHPNLKIIFHSAYPGTDKHAAEVEKLPHAGYLTKGEYNITELINIIQAAF